MVSLVLVAVVIPLTQRSLDRIDLGWEGERGEREALVKAAGDRLGGDLRSALQLTQRLADLGAAAAERDRDAAFRILARATASEQLESGIAILEADGTPWAWAGSHRLPPRAAGDSIASASSQYYVTLESRRHSGRDRVTVANVLVWAHPAVPDRAGSLAERFRASTDVALAVYPTDSAPDNSDVFDYCEPTTAGRRCLFSAQPLPPVQADARALEVSRGGRVAAIGLLLVLVLGLVVETGSAGRWMLAVLTAWLLVRAPVGSLLGAGDLFSPASYRFNPLAPLTNSAGSLGLVGALLTMGAVWLWRRRLPRRWWSVLIGLGLFLCIPFGVSALSRGISPPPDGTPLDLWLTWQLALFLTITGPMVLASALLRGDAEPRRPGWWSWLGVAAAISAAVAGLYLWQPSSEWPWWFPLLWTPVLLVASVPLPSGQAVVSMALAAGSLSSLFTWQADHLGRMQQAEREVARLGTEEDPVAPALLQLFAKAAREAPPPATATELYALWRTSVLADQGYPARLALWTQDAGWGAELALDSLEVGRPTLDSLLAVTPRPDSVVRMMAPPGMHYLLATTLTNGAVLVTVIGPETQLIVPSRLGRLLEPTVHRPPSYLLALSPPMAQSIPDGCAALGARGLGPSRLAHARRGRYAPRGVRADDATRARAAAGAWSPAAAGQHRGAGAHLADGRLLWAPSGPGWLVARGCALLPRAARRDAGALLPGSGSRLLGVGHPALRTGHRARHRRAHQRDAARCAPQLRCARHPRLGVRCPPARSTGPAHGRRLRALWRRPAHLDQRPHPAGPRRAGRADESGRIPAAGVWRSARGHQDRPAADALRARGIPAAAAGIAVAPWCPGHAAHDWANCPPTRSGTSHWACCWCCSSDSPRHCRARSLPRARCPDRWPTCAARRSRLEKGSQHHRRNAVRRASSSRSSAPSIAWRPTCARAARRWKRRADAPRRCWPPWPPA